MLVVYLKKIAFVGVVFFVLVFSASAGKIEKGYEALKIYNYFEAKRLFTKSIKKDSSAAAFGLATIYFRNDNPFHSLDSAYRYICISERSYHVVTDKDKKEWLQYGFEYINIIGLRSKISSEYYQIALKQNSIAGFDHFIEKNDWANERFHAIYKRDSLAFEQTVLVNNSKAFQGFIAKYPSSEFVRPAQRELELCQYLEKTKSNKIEDYIAFCKEFPRNRHTKDAEDKIYQLSIKANRLDDYVTFIKKYPTNRNIESAWRKVYQLFMIDYADDRIQQFQTKYPNYPFKEELEQDIKFAQRQLMPYKSGELFGFMDYEGKSVITPFYESVGLFNDGLAFAVKNGKYGFVDKGNNVVIDFMYDSASDFEEGRAVVEKNEKYGLIDRAGHIILDLTFDDLGTFSQGLIYGKRDSLYGYYDNTGFQRLEEKYEEAFSFSNGIAKVQIGKNQAYIDIYGSLIVPTLYESIRFYSDSLFVFEMNDKYGIMRKNGHVIDSAKYDMIGELSNDRALFLKKGMVGYLNGAGKIALEAKYDEFQNYLEIGQFNGSYAVVRLKGKYGIIDKMGKLIIPATYLQLGNYSTLTAFNKGKGWGYIDLLNVPVILPQFDFAESFHDGYAIVEKASFLGVIDPKGSVTLPISYTQIERLDKNRVIVSIGNKFGVYNMNGQEIVPVEYQQIRLLEKDFLLLTTSDEVNYLYLPQNKIIKPKLTDE